MKARYRYSEVVVITLLACIAGDTTGILRYVCLGLIALIWVKATDCCQKEKFRDLKARNNLLKSFAKYVIIGGCWKGIEMDGGDIQKMAEELHLIEPHIVTASEADDMFEAGDTKFVFTKWLGD